jgi:hypothetical protein
MTSAEIFTIAVRAPADARRWQRDVIARVSEIAALRVGVDRVEGASRVPPGVDLLFALERVLMRGGEAPSDRVALASGNVLDAPPDLILDLVGDAAPDGDATPRLVFDIDGLPPLQGALRAAFDGDAPVLTATIVERNGAYAIGRWTLAVENRRSLRAGVAMALNRLVYLCRDVVRTLADPAGRMAAPRSGGPVAALRRPPPQTAEQIGFLLQALAQKIVHRLRRLALGRDDWRVIWRFRAPGSELIAPETDGAPFSALPDDGRRFYADPFPIVVGGRSYLFVEEFPYATGKGIISASVLEDDGRWSEPRPALEFSGHGSYPHVFRHDGEVWMIPETGDRRRVELWRAVEFPLRWRLHTVLLENIEVYDATPVFSDGQWRLFGAVRDPGCSSWDTLGVWTAPALAGPWTPLEPFPALIDARSARPAGRIFADTQGLLRPAQTSCRRYGEGLALTRPSFDAHGAFYESVVKRWSPPAPLTGLHSWNVAVCGERILETMDVIGSRRFFADARRLDLRVERDPSPDG